MSAEIKKTAEKENFLSKPAVQSIIASLLCIIVGLFIGYIALLFINAQGATDAIITIIKKTMI